MAKKYCNVELGRRRAASKLNGTDDENFDDSGDLEPEYVIKTRINEDGTISNYFDKRKLRIAPRSTLQFKVGPPFYSGGRFRNLRCVETGELMNLKLLQRIDRGFDNIGDDWVGYKRNYFTLVAAFTIDGWDYKKFLSHSFTIDALPANDETVEGSDICFNVRKYSDLHSDRTLPVEYFAVKIRATDDHDNDIPLVQHTAKRDKGPQFSPDICPIIPSPLPNHQVIREASNVRNIVKKQKFDPTFHFYRNKELNNYPIDTILGLYPDNCIKKVARFERVQFSASNNVDKHFDQNRFFKLHVMFGVAVTESSLINSEFLQSEESKEIFENTSEPFELPNGRKYIFLHIEEMETPALIIRGRSPSNYTPANYSPPKKIIFDEVSSPTNGSSPSPVKNVGIISIKNRSRQKEQNKRKRGNASLNNNYNNCQRPAKRKACVRNANESGFNFTDDNSYVKVDRYSNEVDLTSQNIDSSVLIDKSALEAIIEYNALHYNLAENPQKNNKKPVFTINSKPVKSAIKIDATQVAMEVCLEENKLENTAQFDPSLSERHSLSTRYCTGLSKSGRKRSKNSVKPTSTNLSINMRDLEVRPTMKSFTDPGMKIGSLLMTSNRVDHLSQQDLPQFVETGLEHCLYKETDDNFSREGSVLTSEENNLPFLENNTSFVQNSLCFTEHPFVFDRGAERSSTSHSNAPRTFSRLIEGTMITNSYQAMEGKLVDLLMNSDSPIEPTMEPFPYDQAAPPLYDTDDAI